MNKEEHDERLIELELEGYSKAAAKIIIKILDKKSGNTVNTNFQIRNDSKKYKYNKKFTEEELLWLYPLNNRYDIYLADRLTIRYMLQEYNSITPKYYFLLQRRNGKTIPIPLLDLDESLEISFESILKVLRDKKNLALINSSTAVSMRKRVVSYKEGKYYFRKKEILKEELLELLSNENGTIITENIRADLKSRELFDGKSPSVNVQTLNGKVVSVYLTVQGGDDTLNKNTLKRHIVNKKYLTDEENRKLFLIVEKLNNFFPEAEYLNYELIKTKKGFKIVSINSGLELLEIINIKKDLLEYLNKKANLKKMINSRSFIDEEKLRERKRIEATGFNYRAYEAWIRDLNDDCKNKLTTKEGKSWAHERGFYSYRIKQFDLNEENLDDYLPDFTYKWLRNINCKYRKWIGDKMLIRYILNDFVEYLPKLYYSLIKYDGQLRINKKQDLPIGYKGDFNGIINLLENEKKLVMKPIVGSRGIGFYRMQFIKGEFFLNDINYSKKEMFKIINNLDGDYVITEYVNQCSFLTRIYPETVSTVRLMVINRDGKLPKIMDAYIRIGCVKSGFTDNISRGGLVAKVDIDTGELLEPESFNNYIYKDCKTHPDTGIRIEGKLPNWKTNIKLLLKMIKHLSPIEYMGVDMAITEEGFKILEINRHQDLHRYQNYSDEVHHFFMEKIEFKKNKYNVPYELLEKELEYE